MAKEMMQLRSSDGEIFKVEKIVAQQSELINRLIEDNYSDSIIPLPLVTSETLSRILKYCRRHTPKSEMSLKRPAPNSDESSSSSYEEELKNFDTEFVDVDQAILYDLITAANYMEIKGLLELTCRKVADMIKGKTPEEIRETFNIVNDFTPEEEEEIRKQNSWAFD